MKKNKLQTASVEDLVERFMSIALKQDEALLDDRISEVNRLFHLMEEVEAELKSRSGDQRRALMSLYSHPNAEVRLKSAKATLALVPEEARAVLQQIRERQEQPQALDAGMTIRALDQGIFKPT